MSARPLLALLAALVLALPACGADEENEPASSIQTSASTETEPARVAVAAEAAKSPGTICRGLSRKKSSKAGKSAFSLCTSSVAKARKTKSAAKACKGLSAKKDKTLRSSPKSICKKAAKEALKASKPAKKKDDIGGDETVVDDGDGTEEADPDADAAEDGDVPLEDDEPAPNDEEPAP